MAAALLSPFCHPRLARATPAERENWRLIGKGIGIHWEDVDEDER
jgi:hypothetical protein